MKKLTFLLALFMIFLTAPLSAQSESDFIVAFTEDNQGVVITRYTGSVATVRIPATIQGLPVREIGDRAFDQGMSFNPSGPSSVVIPEGVTTIGRFAFSNCSRLASVTLPSSLAHIRENAFLDCRSLRTITFPAGLISIGEAAFSRSGLTSISWPSSITTIPSGVFGSTPLQTIVIPEGVTAIDSNAFWQCGALTSVTLPSTIERIGRHAFQYCSNLVTLTIPATVTAILFEEDSWSWSRQDIHDSFSGSNRIPLATQTRLRSLGYEGRF